MPDPVLMLEAMGVAFAAAAVMLAAFGWPWRASRPARIDAGWVLGMGAGTYLGCLVLGIRPHWPPREDLDRMLALVLPSVILVELLAAVPKVPRWVIWLLRLAVAGGTARILLHGSIYLTDVAGPGTREWSTSQAWLVLGGLAAALAVVWALLDLLARRAPGLSTGLCMAVAIAATALTVMLSGYATGGQAGLPMAAALAGAILAALLLPGTSRRTGPLGVAIVGLFSLLIIGRFFGDLTSTHAALLFFAPLLAWLPEVPWVRRLPSWARGLARVILVGALVSVVVFQAARTFVAKSQAPSEAGAGSKEPSIQDYMDFGK